MKEYVITKMGKFCKAIIREAANGLSQKKQNENIKAIFLRNMLKHQRVDENCLTGKSELSELIEMFDDSKEKISDGEYLTLMNKSKKIYENFEKIRLANM